MAAETTESEGRLPDFICIGVQKAGTTWLWKMLREHPQVRMPPKKELHYFDREIYEEPVDWYKRWFRNPKGTATVFGEKTPCYAHMPKRSIRLVHALLPKVKLILMLRQPAERAWSQARMEVSGFNTGQLGRRYVLSCLFNTGLIRNTRRTDYRRILSNWGSIFPDHQILVVFYDEITSDAEACYRRVLQFLEVDSIDISPCARLREPVWESASLDLPPAVRWYLRRRYRNTARWVTERFPGSTQSWLEGGSYTEQGSWIVKLWVWTVAYVATIPYNAAYLTYSALRDLRKVLRIPAIKRSCAQARMTDSPVLR